MEEKKEVMKNAFWNFLFIYLNENVNILVMIATEEEMISAKLPLENRDYCAHLALKLQQCRKEVWPWAWKCNPEKHEYLSCQYEE